MIVEFITQAFLSLLNNKARSVLTMVGVTVGVAALIVVFAVGAGGRTLIVKEVENFGSNLIMVNKSYNVSKYNPRDNLTLKDGEKISQLPTVQTVVPIVHGSEQLQRRGKSTSAWVLGTTALYQSVRNTELLSGTFLSEDDVAKRNPVCVLNETTAQELFGTENPLGQKISFGLSASLLPTAYSLPPGRVRFKVIGIVKRKVSSLTELIEERQPVFVPITYLQKKRQTKSIDGLFVSAKSYEQVDEAVSQIKSALISDNLKIQTLKDVLETLYRILRIVSLIIGSVAFVCLLVGGIGIMNIMLVSVSERTREIGVRMAIGAKRKHILIQFLSEATALSTVGGVAGIFLGLFGAQISSRFAQWPPIITPLGVLLSFFFSVIVGVSFGLYPAYRASRLQPVEALRYE